MRVSTVVSPYAMVNKTNQVNKKTNNNVSFGLAIGYNRAFEFATKQTFSRTTKGAKTTVTEMFNRLLNAVQTHSSDAKSHECNRVIDTARRIGIKRLDEIASNIGLGRNESRNLIVYKGDVVLGIHNLGPYSKGLFSTTDHDQIVLEFRDPATGRFIGFSRDSEDGIAITKNSERYELYDKGATYEFKSLSRQGYQPDAYVDYVGENGEEPRRSFWDWL